MEKQVRSWFGVHEEHVRKLWNNEGFLWAAPWLLSNMHIYCSIYCQRKHVVGPSVWACSGRMAHRMWSAHPSSSWVPRGRKEKSHIATNSGEGPSSLLTEEDIKPLLWVVGVGEWLSNGEKSPHIHQYCQPMVHFIAMGKGQPSTAGSQPGSRQSPLLVSFLHDLKTESQRGATWRHSGQNRPFLLSCIPE